MEIKRIGNIYGEDKGTGFAGNVWDKEGLSPTITTMQGGGREPMIIEETKCVGGLSETTWGGKQFHQGDRVYKGDVALALPAELPGGSYKYCVAMRGRGKNNEQQLEPNRQGVVNSLTTVQKDNLVMEKKINKVGQISNDGSQCGTEVSDGGLSPTLTAGTHGYANSHVLTRYRIRKLTPRECWRLMGFSDEDFGKAEKVCSATQLYKQAGNSIVVNVLMAIFSQMNIKGVKPWNEVHNEKK